MNLGLHYHSLWDHPRVSFDSEVLFAAAYDIIEFF